MIKLPAYLKRLLAPSIVSGGVIVGDNNNVTGVIAPTNNAPNRLDELCIKYNASYTRRRVDGIVVLKLYLNNGTVLAAQSTNTQEAISLLTIQAEKWQSIQ